MLFFYLFVVYFGVVVGFVCFLCFCVCAFFSVCVCVGGGRLLFFLKNNNNISLFCLFVWVFSGGCEVICGFFGGQDQLLDVCHLAEIYQILDIYELLDICQRLDIYQHLSSRRHYFSLIFHNVTFVNVEAFVNVLRFCKICLQKTYI